MTELPPKLQISEGSALSNRDNRLSSQDTFTYTIFIKPGAEDNRLKPTVTRQHLPDFGAYSLSTSFQLRCQRKQMKETTYIYIYIYRERHLQASHILHDEHIIWCGKTNSSAHSKREINTLRVFGGDKLAYRFPSSHKANQGKNEGNVFSLKLSLTQHDQISCEKKFKHTFNEGLENFFSSCARA